MKKIEFIIFGLLVWLFLGCEKGSDYDQLIKRELASGVINDSLFLEFGFGDTQKEFYKNGWEQNKKGLISQGPRNMTVKYMMANNTPGNSSIQMLFYPVFDQNQEVKTMNLTFSYSGWAPWNRRFCSDSLLVAVQDTLMSWYGGNEFIKVTMPNQNKELMVKVDGNRMISLAAEGDQNVQGYIKDLTNIENKQ